MKAKVYRAVCLIVALVVAVFTAGYAFAWFIDRRNSPFEISGASAGAYFDSTSGDGTSADQAFVIANATHMRNLAVLQNTGRFVDAAGNPKTYYFEIKKTVDEIDMDGLWLPPIGNDKDPFIGVFNGNGKTIKNLKVTTDKTLLTVDNYPTQASPDYEFSNAVGLFGNTGEASEIRNFILDNPIVLVGSESKTLYGSAGKKVVGIAVGHVAGKCSSIGVRATDDAETSLQIVDANTKYSTFNSILGELGEGVESSVTGGGHTAGTGGSGASFGANFDVASLLTRLNNIVANKNSATPSWRLPDMDTSNAYPVPDALRKVAFSVTDKSTYEGADAIEVVANNNIGYFMGNQNKITTTKELTFDDPMVLSGNNWVMSNTKRDAPRWFYSYKTQSGSYDTMAQDASYEKSVFQPLSQEEYDSLPQGIIDLLPEKVGEKKRLTAIRLSETFNNTAHPNYNNGIGGWSFHGQISHMGKTYGKGFMGADGKVVDENGESTGDMLNQWNGKIDFYAYEGGIYLPNNAIWFKPAQAGKIQFVIYAETMKEGFALVKITRNGATAENPFYTAPNTTSWGYGEDIDFTPVMRTSLPSGVLLYFEHDVTAAEVAANNVEYMILQYGNNGADFVYLDIGASAAEDTSAVNPDVQVSAVDFIYDKVEISQADVTGTDIKLGDFIVTTSGSAARYDSSKTSVYFEELTTVLKIVYVRLHNDTAGNHSGKTICLEGSTPTLNTNSEVKATYATYVCTTISGGSGTVSGGGGGGGGTEEPDPTVKVSSVTISSSADSVTMGNTLSLSANVLPEDATDKTVTWTVTDGTGSATISSGGVLTPVSPGTVTVTATAGGKSATKTITVNAASQPAATATVNIDDYNTLSGKTLAISAKADGVEYFKITSTLGYKYVSNNDAVGGPVIISSNNNRPMTVEIGSGVAADKSVEVTLKIAIAQKEALQLGSTATFTSSGTATVELGGVQVTSVTTTDNNTVVELKITLKGSDASLRIDCENRIALVSASAIIK